MKTVVGVLRGGPSSEYEVSLKSGANVLQELSRDKYEPIDIFIDRQGTWHLHGVPVTPERALTGVDVAFNVLHGEYGEDGSVQQILSGLGVPYTGSDAFSSALAFNKHATKEVAKKLGIKVAHGLVVEPEEDIERTALEIFRSFPHPAIIKPVIGGSSVGMSVADSYHALLEGLVRAAAVSPKILVEEFIKGREATVGVIDGFRGEKTYALFPVEIIPPQKHAFFNYEAKYGGETLERVPGNFSDAEKKHLAQAAKMIHEELGASQYSRSDFIVSKRGIYFLELNSAAAVGLTSESLFPKAVRAVGSSMSDFFDHVIELALHGRRD